MKRILSLLLLLSWISSCNDSTSPRTFVEMGDSPSAVAIAFRTSLVQGKLGEAKKLGTASTKRVLDHLVISGPLLPDYNVSFIRDSIAQGRAFVVLKEVGGDTLPKIQLIKQDGQWKVDLLATYKKKVLKKEN
ncbi:hypothetical protein [Nafulsella turpanensis]|uniref:hypothetical protein n=1 Tax=Nafulsella turpanensis TaxID=1265690 RepID=UPI000477CD5C|nr:hypothetical protein [Nafulsella turpanensis]